MTAIRYPPIPCPGCGRRKAWIDMRTLNGGCWRCPWRPTSRRQAQQLAHAHAQRTHRHGDREPGPRGRWLDRARAQGSRVDEVPVIRAYLEQRALLDVAVEVDELELWAGRLRLGRAEWWALVGSLRLGPDPGILVGASALFFDESGALMVRGRKLRRTFGADLGVRGASVRLGSGAGGRIVVVEGVEDGLGAMALGLGDAWACCGASGMRSLQVPRSVEAVTIVADSDPTGRLAARSLTKRLRAQGRAVRVLEPDRPGADVAEIWLVANSD